MDRSRRTTVVAVLCAAACFAACASADTPDEQSVVPTCDEAEATVCVLAIDSLNSSAVVALNEAVELDRGSGVEVESGVCSRGGDGPEELTWSLCQLTLDDGRQVALGRSTDSGMLVRATVQGEAIEFALATAPGEATVLDSPAETFVIVNADGDEVGSVGAFDR